MEPRRLDRALQDIDREIDRSVITSPLQAVGESPSFTLEVLPSIRTFVGREEELTYYRSLLEQGNIAIIEGMAGNGKTWLGARLAMAQSNRIVFWMTFRK